MLERLKDKALNNIEVNITIKYCKDKKYRIIIRAAKERIITGDGEAQLIKKGNFLLMSGPYKSKTVAEKLSQDLENDWNVVKIEIDR